jgi:hypothetical protein
MAVDTDNRSPEQISLTRFLRERLRRRLDSEHEQAFLRVVIVFILAAYYFTLAALGNFTTPALAWGFYWALGYLLLSLVYVGLILAWPHISPPRRLAAMVTDFATLTAMMHWGARPARRSICFTSGLPSATASASAIAIWPPRPWSARPAC